MQEINISFLKGQFNVSYNNKEDGVNVEDDVKKENGKIIDNRHVVLW